VVYSVTKAEGQLDSEGREMFDIRMQDLVSGMIRPCAMALVMGTRTITPDEFTAQASEPRQDLLGAMEAIDKEAPTPEDRDAGISQRRYLSFLDERSSTATLGFRIDAFKTMVDGALCTLPLPEGLTLARLREERDVVRAVSVFVQHDKDIAAAFLLKLESLMAALERSAFFFKHSLVRTTMLLVYDDAAKAKMELKMMNFGSSHALPNGERLDHTAPWDGTAGCHEDGYLIGVQSLVRVMETIKRGGIIPEAPSPGTPGRESEWRLDGEDADTSA